MSSSAFARDVDSGLSATQKFLSSKYFYDSKGDRLFQRIMALDEYYLTNAEAQIFQQHADEILETINPGEPFRLVELGAGDGQKTKILLKHFLAREADFSYCPVDISSAVLDQLEQNIKEEVPGIEMNPLAGDYFEVLADLKFKHDARSVVFFLGSNIGNFLHDTVRQFLKKVHDNLQQGDLILIGFDLKKDPQKVLSAYNDSQGVTRDFNKNLLRRINYELGGNFDLNNFMHHPVYDPVSGECRSYLISKQACEVYVEQLDKTYTFSEWEPIYMEVSKKYHLHEIKELAEASGFKLIRHLTDADQLFADSIWQVE